MTKLTTAKTNCAFQAHPTAEQIQARAYELYLNRGCQPGQAMDDWLQAEYELLQLPIDKLVELPPVRFSNRTIQASALIALIQAAALLGSNAVTQVHH